MTVNRVAIPEFVEGIFRWQCCYLSGITSLSTPVNVSLVMCKGVKQDQDPVGLYMTANL